MLAINPVSVTNMRQSKPSTRCRLTDYTTKRADDSEVFPCKPSTSDKRRDNDVDSKEEKKTQLDRALSVTELLLDLPMGQEEEGEVNPSNSFSSLKSNGSQKSLSGSNSQLRLSFRNLSKEGMDSSLASLGDLSTSAQSVRRGQSTSEANAQDSNGSISFSVRRSTSGASLASMMDKANGTSSGNSVCSITRMRRSLSNSRISLEAARGESNQSFRLPKKLTSQPALSLEMQLGGSTSSVLSMGSVNSRRLSRRISRKSLSVGGGTKEALAALEALSTGSKNSEMPANPGRNAVWTSTQSDHAGRRLPRNKRTGSSSGAVNLLLSRSSTSGGGDLREPMVLPGPLRRNVTSGGRLGSQTNLMEVSCTPQTSAGPTIGTRNSLHRAGSIRNSIRRVGSRGSILGSSAMHAETNMLNQRVASSRNIFAEESESFDGNTAFSSDPLMMEAPEKSDALLNLRQSLHGGSKHGSRRGPNKRTGSASGRSLLRDPSDDEDSDDDGIF